MTVEVSTARASYSGNGVTTAFNIPFRILDQTHISVLSRNDTTGAETELALTTDYTVAGVGDATSTLNMLVAPASGTTLVILRGVPITQLLDYVEGDTFPAESHEDALDKVTMILQQISDQLTRTFRLQDSDPTVSIELPDVVLRKGKYLSFDSVTGAPSVASVVEAGTLTVSAFMETVLTANNAAAARSTLGADVTQANANIFTAAQTIRSSDAGATAGPTLNLFRDSASPAASDLAGQIVWQGKDDGGTDTDYAKIIVKLDDITAAGKYAQFDFYSVNGGSGDTFMGSIGLGGWQIGTPTGGAKAYGSVNVGVAYYLNGTLGHLATNFESSEKNLSAGTGGTIAHGLSARPTRVQAFLRCKTAEGGYSVGAEVPIDYFRTSGGSPEGVNAWTDDATNIKYRVASTISVMHATTGADFVITMANWKAFFRATTFL